MNCTERQILTLGKEPARGARSRKSVSVVIPAYHSERTLGPLVDRLTAVLRRHGEPFEIILVNDGSPDGTWERVEALAAEHSRVVGIDLTRNYGQHSALLCGVRAARYDVIVTIDDDLQHPPEEIPKLLARLEDDVDVVYGTSHGGQHGLWRNLASGIIRLTLQSAMGAATARDASAFRAFRTELRGAFAKYESSFVSIDVLLTWGTTRFTSTTVRHDPRRIGRSNYTFGKLLTHALNMLTGFSVLPLQVASVMGFVLTGFGLLALAYVVGRYLIEGGSVPGFPFLASLISIFSGAQMFALGIIGEYLARTHHATMMRPSFAIRRRTDPDSHEHNPDNSTLARAV
ncbi:MAG: glycosyltransferase [Phycisphaerae bacterium]